MALVVFKIRIWDPIQSEFFLSKIGSGSHFFTINYVFQEVMTHFKYINLLYKMGQDCLDIQYSDAEKYAAMEHQIKAKL